MTWQGRLSKTKRENDRLVEENGRLRAGWADEERMNCDALLKIKRLTDALTVALIHLQDMEADIEAGVRRRGPSKADMAFINKTLDTALAEMR